MSTNGSLKLTSGGEDPTLQQPVDGWTSRETSSSRRKFHFDWKEHTSLFGLIIVVGFAAYLSPTFFTSANLMNLLSQIAFLGVLAVGMTFVILTAGIDLSVGSLLALAGVAIAMTAQQAGPWAGVGVALAIGAFAGWMHGAALTKLKVPAFIVTLAGYSAYRGLAHVMTGSQAVPVSGDFFNWLGYGRVPGLVMIILGAVALAAVAVNLVKYIRARNTSLILQNVLAVVGLIIFTVIVYNAGGLPIPVTIFLVTFVAGWFLLNRTAFGRQIYAIGGNAEAARLAGINVNRNLVAVYMILGTLAGIAGLITTARLGAAAPAVGTLAELDAIAAVVIGGTSLQGGFGRLGGTVIGVLLIGVLNNILSLMNVGSSMQLIVKGVIIVAAVAFDTKIRKQSN